MEKIKLSEKATNEQVLEHIVEKRTLLNNILGRACSQNGGKYECFQNFNR